MVHSPNTKLCTCCDKNEACRIQSQILEEVKAKDFDDNTVFAVRLALEEALANAIRHGNCNDPDKQVTVEYRVTPDEVEIIVSDEGCGFAPEHLPDPTAEENIERPCGRGVMLIKAYMTEVEFNDRGNTVRMVKRRDSGD